MVTETMCQSAHTTKAIVEKEPGALSISLCVFEFFRYLLLIVSLIFPDPIPHDAMQCVPQNFGKPAPS